MPTYRNDSTTQTYRIRDINGDPQNVIPGHTVQTFARSVPSDFTETSDSPFLERKIHVSGEDVFTSAIRPQGYFNTSVSGEFVGTVRLERSFDGFATAKTMDSFTFSLEDEYTDEDPNAEYRLGVRAGELTSGNVTVVLSLAR
jgi:hypothetical protein